MPTETLGRMIPLKHRCIKHGCFLQDSDHLVYDRSLPKWLFAEICLYEAWKQLNLPKWKAPITEKVTKLNPKKIKRIFKTMSLQDGEDMEVHLDKIYHKYICGSWGPSIWRWSYSIYYQKQPKTTQHVWTSGHCYIRTCNPFLLPSNDPRQLSLLYLEPCETLRNDKLQECILSRSACHSIYKHSSAHQGRPRVWFHTCITTEAGPGEAAWAQQIIFQPIQDHGLRRVMGCPLTADWKWMVDRAHVTCIPFNT